MDINKEWHPLECKHCKNYFNLILPMQDIDWDICLLKSNPRVGVQVVTHICRSFVEASDS